MNLPAYISGVQRMAAAEFKAYVDAHTDHTDDVPTEIEEPSVHARKYEENLLGVLVTLDYAYDNVDPYGEGTDYSEAHMALREAEQAAFRAAIFARQAVGYGKEADAAYVLRRCITEAADFILGD